jgi:hypothetical protein
MAVVVVVSTEEASAVAVSAVAVLVVGSTEEASAVVVSAGDVSAVAVSTVIRGGGTGAIRTDITVTTITHTAGTHTADTVTTVGPVSDTALAADQGISELGDKPDYSCSAPRVEPNNFRYRDGYLESVLAGRTKGRHAVKRDGLL